MTTRFLALPVLGVALAMAAACAEDGPVAATTVLADAHARLVLVAGATLPSAERRGFQVPTRLAVLTEPGGDATWSRVVGVFAHGCAGQVKVLYR